jgi:RimK family alpha-L-glutamate ligase
MLLAILCGGDGWHVRDLDRAAQKLGLATIRVDFRSLRAGVAAAADTFAGADAVLVRTMPPGSLEQVVFRMDVLQRVESTGIAVINPPRSLECCIDKYLATARLRAAGLPVPPTIVCQRTDEALEAFAELGCDVVVKPLFGSEGRGMLRIAEQELAWRTFRAIEQAQNVIYLQKYIAHPGWDLRVFVLGGQVLTAMRRHARDDWRTNVAQGGRAEPARINADEEHLALAAAKACGAVVAGVDLLPGPDGQYLVLEVNAVPGWRALSATTDIDVATRLVQFIAAAVKNA